MKEVQRCPVCNGKGIVPSGFYTFADGNKQSSTAPEPNTLSAEQCRSCGGKGYLIVPQDVPTTPSPTWFPTWPAPEVTCNGCGNREDMIYMSDPPQVKCKKDGELHHIGECCDDFSSKSDSKKKCQFCSNCKVTIGDLSVPSGKSYQCKFKLENVDPDSPACERFDKKYFI